MISPKLAIGITELTESLFASLGVALTQNVKDAIAAFSQGMTNCIVETAQEIAQSAVNDYESSSYHVE